MVINDKSLIYESKNEIYLIKQAFDHLEKSEWNQAVSCCKKAVAVNPQCVQAYLGMLMAELQIKREEDLSDAGKDFSDSKHYQDAIQFGNKIFRKKLEEYNNQAIYNNACLLMKEARDSIDYSQACEIFRQLENFSDSAAKAAECNEKASEYLYNIAIEEMRRAKSRSDYLKVAIIFEKILDYKNSAEKKMECEKNAEQFSKKVNEKNFNKQTQKSHKKFVIICMSAVIAASAMCAVALNLIIKSHDNDKTVSEDNTQITNTKTTTKNNAQINKEKTTKENHAQNKVKIKNLCDDSSHWGYWSNEEEGCAASMKKLSNGVSLEIAKTGELSTINDEFIYYPYYNHLYYSEINLEKDSTYHLEFDYETTKDTQLQILIQQNYGDYDYYFAYDRKALANDSNHFSVYFTMYNQDKNASINFNCDYPGLDTPYTVEITNLSLVKIS